jgi:hypothetical protein
LLCLLFFISCNFSENKKIKSNDENISSLNTNAKSDSTNLYLGHLISDSTTLRYARLDSKLEPILKSKNKIEIRFIEHPSFQYPNYIVLTFNDKWEVKYFSVTSNETIEENKINNEVNLDTFFSKLVANNIFSLPDQKKLNVGKEFFNINTNEVWGKGVSVNDGSSYVIEFKVGNNYRSYSFSNPDAYADLYTSSHELREFTNIVTLFKNVVK